MRIHSTLADIHDVQGRTARETIEVESIRNSVNKMILPMLYFRIMGRIRVSADLAKALRNVSRAVLL